MRLHPILEVGNAIEEAVYQGSIPNTNQIIETINYIKQNGIEGVLKDE